MASALALASYVNGTEACAVTGVVCPNDVAVLVLNPQNGRYAGTTTGTLGYGFSGFGFNARNLR